MRGSTAHDTPPDQRDAPQDAPQDTPRATPQVARLLSALEGELERGTLQALFEISDRKYFRKAYLNPDIEGGLVEMTIPSQPYHKNQKYRLTRAGERWLKDHKP